MKFILRVTQDAIAAAIASFFEGMRSYDHIDRERFDNRTIAPDFI